MSLDSTALHQRASELGFRTDVLEKVVRLTELLDGLFAHAYLRPRLALKGGTALNLFVLDTPRLSVDIDLNYVGSSERDVMMADRPKVEHAIRAVCERSGLAVRKLPSEHAGGKWRLAYTSVLGAPGRLELDLNFLLRVPLWPPVLRDSRPTGTLVARRVPVLDTHELAAGKLAALCSRAAGRDLFDTRELLQRPGLDHYKLRLGFYVYGAMSRRDWRDVRVEDVVARPSDIERELLPMLRLSAGHDFDPAAWTEALVLETRELLRTVLPPDDRERDFLDALCDRGEIVAELLTEDDDLRDRIRRQPGLRWKAEHVRNRGRRP